MVVVKSKTHIHKQMQTNKNNKTIFISLNLFNKKKIGLNKITVIVNLQKCILKKSMYRFMDIFVDEKQN